jgi:L-asparaginase
MQKKACVVVVLGTGGTIAGVAATSEDHLGYESAQLGVAQLVAATPAGAGADVETEQVAQLDSKDMDFATWLKLAGRIAHHAARPEVAGVVVTHGTDTLEETAYFLARVIAVAKPVVLTGAMRPASSSEADGPRNLADAIAVAAQAEAAGVVAVLGGTIHAARDVRKIHPTRIDAFSSGDAGPLGHVVAGRLQGLRSWPVVETIGIARLPAEVSRWPRVEIVASTAGADARIVAALLASGVDGIVVAATGNGTVHHDLEPALAEAMHGGVAVLRSTRCAAGGIVDTQPGLLPSAGELTPAKARIELMLRRLSAPR